MTRRGCLRVRTLLKSEFGERPISDDSNADGDHCPLNRVQFQIGYSSPAYGTA